MDGLSVCDTWTGGVGGEEGGGSPGLCSTDWLADWLADRLATCTLYSGWAIRFGREEHNSAKRKEHMTGYVAP